MKRPKTPLIAIGIAAICGLASCGDRKDRDHAGQDHDHPPRESAHGHGADGAREHGRETTIAGPNGGRVLTRIEPRAEFFVTGDRLVQIAFVDDELKPIPAGDQIATVVAGDRANPTRLTFRKEGEVLISDTALPDGNDFPVIVQIKSSADAKSVRQKFNLNLEQCPTCKYQEYACTCEHGEHGEHGEEGEDE